MTSALGDMNDLTVFTLGRNSLKKGVPSVNVHRYQLSVSAVFVITY